MIIILMGVAGSGKTTIGSLLALELGWDFYDTDDFHSESNRAKMSHGIALTDEDRATWLLSLQELITQNIQLGESIVLACSALKTSYRKILSVNEHVQFVYLKGTYEQIEARLHKRTDHFMSADMLAGQFDILEEPQNTLTVDITQTPQEIIAIILKGLNP
jgi:gluconokinase